MTGSEFDTIVRKSGIPFYGMKVMSHKCDVIYFFCHFDKKAFVSNQFEGSTTILKMERQFSNPILTIVHQNYNALQSSSKNETNSCQIDVW